MMFGAQPLARDGFQRTMGAQRHTVRRARHEVTADGIRLFLPEGPVLSDDEARRLAWAILADVAPDDVDAMPEAVTYMEAQRLAVLRAIKAGHDRVPTLAAALNWKRRNVERRLAEMISDGRVERTGVTRTRRFNISFDGVL